MGEDPFDPALQQPRQRPPVDRKHQHQAVGAVDARLLGQHIGRRRRLLAMDVEVGHAVALIEAFGTEVGQLEAVAGCFQAFGDPGCQAVGERVGIGVGDNDQGVHVRSSCSGFAASGSARYAGHKLLSVSYDW
ncbi:hypothetical protein D9M70_602370 [compost metagenome]